MVVDDTLSMRIYSFIDNILINKTIKQIKQKIDFIVFCVRHLGLIVTAVTINGFTPVFYDKLTEKFSQTEIVYLRLYCTYDRNSMEKVKIPDFDPKY